MLHEWSFVWWDCSVFDRQTEWQTDTLESHRFPCVLTTLVWDIWQCLFFLDCLSLIVQNAKPNCFIHFTLSHSISIHFEKQKERPESGLIRCKSIGISVCPFVGFCCCFFFWLLLKRLTGWSVSPTVCQSPDLVAISLCYLFWRSGLIWIRWW